MDVRSLLGHVGTLALASVVVVLIVGTLLGQPVLVSFVDSGSMRPALAPGDGFVVLPKALTGPVSRGDVIVFRAERIHNGGYVTHRVVDVADRGYVTKGDANAFTDQATGEPPVQSAQVVGVVVQVDGQPVVIPALGRGFERVGSAVGAVQVGLARALGLRTVPGVQAFAYLLFVLSVVWYLVGIWQERSRHSRQRPTARDTGSDVRLVLLVMVVFVIVAATLGMAGPAGPERFEFVSAYYDSAGPRVIQVGTTETTIHRMGNPGILPMFVFLEVPSDGVAVHPRTHRIGSGEVATATVTIQAPTDIGYYHRYIVERRYFAVLPQPVIRALMAVHPWAPIVVIDAGIGLALYVIGLAMAGSPRLRDRSRDHARSIRRSVWRVVRSCYRE